MALKFTDAFGFEGRISDDFSVEYEGPIEVATFVEDVLDSAVSEQEATTDLIVRMPDELDVVEVEQL